MSVRRAFLIAVLTLGCASAADLPVGHKVPELTLVDLDGHAVTLASFRGRVVLAKFGYTW